LAQKLNNKMTNIYEIEDKVKKWIETKRFQWYSILFGTGFFLAWFYCYLLGYNFGTSYGFLLMGTSYGFLLMLIERTCGGSGLAELIEK